MMEKTCICCGTALAEDAVLCPECGAEIREIAMPTESKEEKTRKPAKTVFIGIAALAAVAIVFLLFSMAFAKPYTTALDNYYFFTLTGDEDAFKALAPEEYWDWYEERYSRDLEDLMADRAEQLEASAEFYEDFIGENTRFSYDFRKISKYTDHQVEMFGECLEDTYDIDADSVTRAYHLFMDVTIQGENGVQVVPDISLGVIEIEGVWYIFSPSNSGGELSIRFAV